MINGVVRGAFGKLDWRTQQRILELRARVLKRGGDPRFDYSIASVKATAKHNAPTVVLDRLLRYQRALGYEVDFAGKAVLEVGAGPVLGWALTGLAFGASRYTVLDPSFNMAVLPAMREYFRDQRRWLANVASDPGDPAKLIEEGRITVVRSPGARTSLAAGSVDLVLSNSVLEHVLDVDELLDELARISAPTATQYHFVDFTDHRGRADRFGELYLRHPDEIRALHRHRGLLLNMLRASDIERSMAGRSSVERTVLLSDDAQPSVRSPHPWWAQRYETGDLAIELAAFRLSS